MVNKNIYIRLQIIMNNVLFKHNKIDEDVYSAVNNKLLKELSLFDKDNYEL